MSDVEVLIEGIEQVARFHERRFGSRSPFHLMTCGGCGCPAFQQPCSLCGYYPMGQDRGTWNPKVATKEMFCEMVERSGPGGREGTIATWHALSSLQKYENRETIATAASLVDVPSASDYWDAVVVEGIDLHRPEKEFTLGNVWYAAQDMQAIASGQLFAKPSRRAPEVNALVREWVEAFHSQDPEELLSVIGRLSKMAREMLHEYPRSGNITTAIRALSEAEALLEEKSHLSLGA